MTPNVPSTRPLLVGLALPLWAHFSGEPFTITLATRAVDLALAAVGLNIALGSAAWSALAMLRSSGLAAMRWASLPITRRPTPR
jgi:hypothetical protein